MLEGNPTVFAVIPVFNRLEHTRACLTCFNDQTYRELKVIVVDGGSTDGTVYVVGKHHPSVTILEGKKELWWGGAMELGIAHALTISRCDDDMILMVNNDVQIAPDFVDTLVRVSRRENAAVGGLIVDAEDPCRIVDAGDFIDWPTYSFPVKRTIQPGDSFDDGVDVLSGRGTLVPIRMIKAAGNVNGTDFPHYIADYEFFCRLKRCGFKLGVTYETKIRAHLSTTGLYRESRRLALREAWQLLFSKKSMENIVAHWRFINKCAPDGLRRRARHLLIMRQLRMIVLKTWLEYFALPFLWLSRCFVSRASDRA